MDVTDRPVAVTERLTLRRLTEADAAFVLELLNEPAFLRFIGDREVRTLDEASAYVREVLAASYSTFGFGMYRVGLKAADEPLGFCGLVKREVLRDVDVGFAFLERFWGQGYAFEAARAVLAHAYDDLGLRRVVGITAPDNHGSMAVLRKLGMAPSGTVALPGWPEPRRVFEPE